MGSAKNHELERAGRAYTRNRYYHERARLLKLMRLHARNPGFMAHLQRELDAAKLAYESSKPPRNG